MASNSFRQFFEGIYICDFFLGCKLVLELMGHSKKMKTISDVQPDVL